MDYTQEDIDGCKDSILERGQGISIDHGYLDCINILIDTYKDNELDEDEFVYAVMAYREAYDQIVDELMDEHEYDEQ